MARLVTDLVDAVERTTVAYFCYGCIELPPI